MSAQFLGHYGFRNPFAEEHGSVAERQVSQESIFHKVCMTVLFTISFILLFIFL
jgi:hypothetical protein